VCHFKAQSLDCMSFVTDLHSDVMRTSILLVSCERKLSLVIKDVRKFMSQHPGLKKEECEGKIHNKNSTT
jgi:hypothetical protein